MVFFRQAPLKKSKQIFEIRHVQIDVLPKTIDNHRFKKDQIIEYNALVSFFKFFVGNHVQ